MRPKKVVLLFCRDENIANVWHMVLKSHGYAVARELVGEFPVVDCVLAIKPMVSDVEWLSALSENVLVVMAEADASPNPYTAAGAKYAMKESVCGMRSVLDWIAVGCARKRGPKPVRMSEQREAVSA